MNRAALIVCDGNADVGHGHLVRCLGLAQALAELGTAVIFCGRYGPVAQSLLGEAAVVPAKASPGTAAAAQEAAAAAATAKAELVVVDSYAVDAGFVHALRKPEQRLLLIDDFSGWSDYPSTHVLNFAIDAAQDSYPAAGPTYLLGPSFFPVRRAFRAARAGTAAASRSGVRRVGLAISSDLAARRTLRVLDALADVVSGIHVQVVVSHLPKEEAPQLDAALGRFGAESGWRHGLLDLSDFLAWSDVVICSGGLVKYEAGYMGVPALVMSGPGKEVRDTAAWVERNAAVDLGEAALLDYANLRAMIERVFARADLAEIGKTAQSFFPEDAALRTARAIS